MTNVGQMIARAEKFDNFKLYLREFPNVSVANAIENIYPFVKKSSPRYRELMRAGTLVRQSK